MPPKVCAVAAGEAHTLALTCNDDRRLAAEFFRASPEFGI
jgi:hypothetical protein